MVGKTDVREGTASESLMGSRHKDENERALQVGVWGQGMCSPYKNCNGQQSADRYSQRKKGNALVDRNAFLIKHIHWNYTFIYISFYYTFILNKPLLSKLPLHLVNYLHNEADL